MVSEATNNTHFYIPNSRRALLNKAEAALRAGKLVALEGPEGIGKTALIEEILTLYFEDANKSYVTVTEGLSSVQIRSRIIEQLFGNVLFDPELPLLTSFIELSGPDEILLVIDNLHFLSGQLIGELLQLMSESKNLGMSLHVAVTFNKKVSSTLLNVQSGLVNVITIPTLDKSESFAFLKQYFPDIQSANDSEVKRWIEYSTGMPAQLLSFGTEEPEETNKPFNLILWITILVTASLLLAVGLYSYRLFINKKVINEPNPITAQSSDGSASKVVKPWSENKKQIELQNKIKPVASPTTMYQYLTGQIENEGANSSASKMILNELTEEVKKESESNNIDDRQTATEVAEVSKENESIDTAPETQTAMNIQAMLNSETESDSEDVDGTLEPTLESESMPEQESVADIDTIEPEEDPISLAFFENELRPKTSAELMQEQTIPFEQGIVTNENEGEPVVIPNKRYNIDNQAFLDLPRDKFSLQVTAVSSEEVLAEYLESAPLPPEAFKIYQISRNDNDWIVVTYGIFDTIEAAREEAERILPKAWAKSIAVIQQQIIAYQKTSDE